MRKTPFVIVVITSIASALSLSSVSAEKIDDAISWMYDNNLTIYDNKNDFNTMRWLRRDEASKFYVNFARLFGKTTYVKTAKQCVFSDVDEWWSDLKDYIVEACRLWLFQGSKWKFNPTSQLTNAQAVTVLVRIVAGSQNEIGESHRANNYYAKAQQLEILENVNMNNKDSAATRGNVGVLIYDANTLLNTCAQEWSNSSMSRGPQYYKPCCVWLEWFDPKQDTNNDWGGMICFNPLKWTPTCQKLGTTEEWRYYPNGERLRKEACEIYVQ